MRQSIQSFHPRNRRDLLWIVSNSILVVLSFVLIVTEWFSVTAIQAESIGKQNRFLTTEWYLLQQLRAQTDNELAQKNREIEDLKHLYAQLRAQNNSPNDLDKIEAQLKAAETNREEILAKSISSGLHPSLAAVMSETVAPVASANLQQTVAQLQRQVGEQRARAENSEAEVKELKRRLTVQATAAAKPELLFRVAEALDKAKSGLGPIPPTVAELKTKALIRAILNSRDLKLQYPNLLATFDQYLESLRAREYARGRVAGYDESTQAVRAFDRSSRPPTN